MGPALLATSTLFAAGSSFVIRNLRNLSSAGGFRLGAAAGARAVEIFSQAEDFVSPSEGLKGRKPLDLASVLKKKIQPNVQIRWRTRSRLASRFGIQPEPYWPKR